MAEDVLRKRAHKAALTTVTQEKLETMMGNLFDGTKQVVCVHCRRNTPVPLPSLNELRVLIEALEGQVAPPPMEVNHNVNVLTMSLPEKLALLDEKRRERELLELPRGDDAA